MPTQFGGDFKLARAVRRAKGKRMRHATPRGSHGSWQPAEGRPDPLDLLQAQDKDRLQHLLPIKYGRMAASPFAFLRGSAVVMACDLGQTPVSGQHAVICGDAHLSNFGLFASPERELIFDINDFDEAFVGPWEWDLKRLAASIVVAGRENGFSEATNKELVRVAVTSYAKAMRQFARMTALDVWYFHVSAGEVAKVFDEKASSRSGKTAGKEIAKARTKTQARTLSKMTHREEGARRINYEPPLLVPLDKMDMSGLAARHGVDLDMRDITEQSIRDAWRGYLESLPEERAYLMARYAVEDVALRVGGVGSVGTRCLVLLLSGSSDEDGLMLQLKEAGLSVLEAYLPARSYGSPARRVVVGQRMMQAASDPFLGWHRAPLSGHNYYWRQLKDMKGSLDTSAMDKSGFGTYAAVCAVCLARAHARTGDPAVTSGYLGKNDRFGRALAEFGVAYADQTERDHAHLLEAIKVGRIIAEEGI
jgi:hypothetical protein